MKDLWWPWTIMYKKLNSVPVGQIDARNSKQKTAGHLGPNNANSVAHSVKDRRDNELNNSNCESSQLSKSLCSFPSCCGNLCADWPWSRSFTFLTQFYQNHSATVTCWMATSAITTTTTETRRRYVVKHNLITELYLMAVMETTTCFGQYWPSSGCLGNLRASYTHARTRGVEISTYA